MRGRLCWWFVCCDRPEQRWGEASRLSQGGSIRHRDTPAWANLIRSEEEEWNLCWPPGTRAIQKTHPVNHHHQDLKSPTYKQLTLTPPDSPWLLTKKLTINDDDEHWTLSYISLPILSLRTFKFVRNQNDLAALVKSWDNDGQANLEMDILIFWYFDILHGGTDRGVESRNTNHSIRALPAPFKYTSTGSKVDWTNYYQEVEIEEWETKLSCFVGYITRYITLRWNKL